ncbi:MAG: PAS domain S-box protein [Kiritimatiellae bacterium]|nr:PAS domain S-box protein [Kiritimatiellia bacterium]MDD5521519.1 PAS domain S-box protein [Kiritimatiellia bacterium]
MSTAVTGLAFVAAYVGIHHLIFYTRTRDRLEFISFALMCFSIVVYDVASAGIYSVSNASESVFWLQWQFRASIFFGILFLQFVSDLIGRTSRKWDYVLWTCWLVLLLVHLLPFVREWSGTETVPKICSMFGLRIIYHESESGLLTLLRDALALVTVVYAIVSLLRFARQGGRSEARPILVGLTCVIAAVLNDVCVENRLLQTCYMLEWGFMVLIFGVTYSAGMSHFKIRSDLNMSEVQRRRLAEAVNDTDESIMITDTKGIIQYVNPAFERMTGYSSAECLGHPASMLKSGKQDSAFYKDMWDRISAGKMWRGTFIDRRKDGNLFEEESTISPIRDETGKIISYVAVKRDVTRERFMEKQIQRSQNMSAIGQFAHRVAHDFNNALTAILANSELIRKEADSRGLEQISRCIDQIKMAGRGIARLNGDLMAFAHPGKLQMRKVRTDRILQGSEDLIRRSVGSGTFLSIDVKTDVGTVMVDQSRFEKALIHLVLNACEAMNEAGTLTITIRKMTASDVPIVSRLSAIPEDDPKISMFAVIVVSDEGHGISEDDVTKIFDPFFTTRDKNRRAGLGLSHVWQIVNEHGGYVCVESRAGQGTTFRIFLPIIQN